MSSFNSMFGVNTLFTLHSSLFSLPRIHLFFISTVSFKAKSKNMIFAFPF